MLYWEGAVSPSCTEMILPAVGKYELSGTVVDAAGRQLTSSLSLGLEKFITFSYPEIKLNIMVGFNFMNVGSSQEEWNLRPLSSFDAVSLRLDKETYVVGDTAQVCFRISRV